MWSYIPSTLTVSSCSALRCECHTVSACLTFNMRFGTFTRLYIRVIPNWWQTPSERSYCSLASISAQTGVFVVLSCKAISKSMHRSKWNGCWSWLHGILSGYLKPLPTWQLLPHTSTWLLPLWWRQHHCRPHPPLVPLCVNSNAMWSATFVLYMYLTNFIRAARIWEEVLPWGYHVWLHSCEEEPLWTISVNAIFTSFRLVSAFSLWFSIQARRKVFKGGEAKKQVEY